MKQIWYFYNYNCDWGYKRKHTVADTLEVDFAPFTSEELYLAAATETVSKLKEWGNLDTF